MARSGKRLVYSPDLVPYSFEGKGWVLGTITSFFVAPIRLTLRVMHNIFIMPAGIQGDFAEGLFVVAGLTSLLGLADLIFFHKWVLIVSQLPLFPYAYKLRKSAVASKDAAEEKRQVDIDTDEVSTLANTVYDELNQIIKE